MTTRVMLSVAARLALASCLFGGVLEASHAQSLTFHTTAPTPGPEDVFNFVGASRDGLNVNDTNGLDGPLNDDFTTVSIDRPRQGQIFRAPNRPPATYDVVAIWIKVVGYTNNGAMPETGHTGTHTDFGLNGAFRLRVYDIGRGGFNAVPSYPLTGTEPNNPAPHGIVSSENGPGTWLRFQLPPHSVILGSNDEFAFDIGSVGPENRRFEWLGTNEDVYPGGSAYNGALPTADLGDPTRNPLAGDRVFLIELFAVPEPSGLTLTALCGLALLGTRRPKR
jgi:hypothetical protein